MLLVSNVTLTAVTRLEGTQMANFLRIVMDGALGAGDQEAWSTKIDCDVSLDIEEITSVQLNDIANAVMTRFSGLASTNELKTLLSSSGALLRVRTYSMIGTPSSALRGGASTAARVPGAGTLNKTPQTAVVFSLLSGLSGGSFRGRMYWPALQAGVGTNLRQSSQATQAQAMATFLTGVVTDVEGVLNTGASIAIYSPTRNLLTAVSTVQVGDVLDTQRRRRDNLRESYATATLGS
jgi:hypothetical protein